MKTHTVKKREVRMQIKRVYPIGVHHRHADAQFNPPLFHPPTPPHSTPGSANGFTCLRYEVLRLVFE
ncbi:hypothetical protein AGOEGFPJ_00068 [Human alphaherpesvirus 3]